MKLLLEDPRNVRDLLRTARVEVIRLIDFDTLERLKTTFVHRDYRHVEADVVLVASLRDTAGKRRSRAKLLIYVLIEHQSEPDRLMPLRLLDYVVEIEKLFEMGKTIADELKEEGKKEGLSQGMLRARRQTLIRLLGKRFGKIPEEIVRTIETTPDGEELDRWLDNVLTAEKLGEVGVPSAE